MTRDINELLPIVKKKCQEFLDACKSQGINVVVTGTYRSFEEQDALYAKGRTIPGNIVTKAKGGQSLHNWRVAFDCVPVVNGVTMWNDDVLWSKLGQIGTRIGLDWGGTWSQFPDKPHFQYTLGYDWPDFQAAKVDMRKFDLPLASPPKVDNVTPLLNKLTTQIQSKDYKGAKDTCSYLFNELTKI